MLAVLALCSGGLFTTLDFGARTELRVRYATASPLALDFATFPYGRFEAKSRHFELKFDYAASIIVPDLETGFQEPQVYQLGDLSAWYSSKQWTVGVSEGGGYGTMNFSYLSPVPVMNGQPVSGPPPTNIIPCTSAAQCATETVNFGTSTTSAFVRWREGRSSLTLAPSYGVSGGTDLASRLIVPLISEPRFDFVFEHQVTRRDVLLTEGNATAADSTPRACTASTGGPAPIGEVNPPTCAPREQWVGLREKWRHKLTRRAWIEAYAGATIARATTNADDTSANPAKPYELIGYPDVGATLGYELANHDPDRPALHPVVTDPPSAEVYAFTRLGPIIDPFYGIIDPRLQIGAGILKPIDSLYVFNAHVAFVHSTPPTVLDATYMEAWAEVLRHLDRYRFDVGGGIRAAYQNDPFFGEFVVANFYISFVWHEPRIKL